MIEDFGTLFPEAATRFLAINGQRRPTIDMRPGEVQRWRLVGSQYQDNMLLELDKHRLNVIAYDGIQLGAVQEMKQLLIAPGQRADVLVQAGGPGTYELNAMPYDQGHESPTGPLARVVVAGEPLAMKLPAAGGSTVIRSRFLDYTGVFMMHCHMINHEELGMMQAVEVYKD
jgi:FtsP/CotA-like multicopper oxidase with cupredoxin domain